MNAQSSLHAWLSLGWNYAISVAGVTGGVGVGIGELVEVEVELLGG